MIGVAIFLLKIVNSDMLDSERREGRKIALPKDLKIDFIGFDMLRFPLLFPSVYKEIFSSRQE